MFASLIFNHLQVQQTSQGNMFFSLGKGKQKVTTSYFCCKFTAEANLIDQVLETSTSWFKTSYVDLSDSEWFLH